MELTYDLLRERITTGVTSDFEKLISIKLNILELQGKTPEEALDEMARYLDTL